MPYVADWDPRRLRVRESQAHTPLGPSWLCSIPFHFSRPRPPQQENGDSGRATSELAGSLLPITSEVGRFRAGRPSKNSQLTLADGRGRSWHRGALPACRETAAVPHRPHVRSLFPRQCRHLAGHVSNQVLISALPFPVVNRRQVSFSRAPITPSGKWDKWLQNIYR